MQPLRQIEPFAQASDQRASKAFLLEPPPDLDVAEAAELYRVLSNPGGGYSGPWRHDLAPYGVQPMKACTDPRYPKVICAWPAQSGKTDIGLNFMAHSAIVDPADFQIVLPEKQQAEDFSPRRVKRAIDASPALYAKLRDDSKYLFTFDGALVNLTWPTSANAASKPVPRNWLDERDSMPDDVGSAENPEGDPVELFHKRSQTFGARRKTLVTSSVKRQPTKGAPKPSGLHEMPAAPGITSDYNAGTRRFLYWQCRAEACRGWFVTRFRDLIFAPDTRPDAAVIDVSFGCPHCGSIYRDEDRLRMRGWFLAEGESIDADGLVSGAPRITETDSYWMFGPQAAFITLAELVRKYLVAKAYFEQTGSDTKLRAFWNVDANEHYVPESDGEAQLSPEDLRAAAQDRPLGRIPDGAEVLIASIDNQNDRFEVEWTAFGRDGESWLVDYQRIVAIAADGTPITTGAGAGGAVSLQGAEPVDPAHRLDHWLALLPAVFDRALRLDADPAKGLKPLVVAMDTQGPSGATDKAYKFARWLRRERPDIAGRAMFLRGRGELNPVRVARAQWDPRVTANRATHRRGVDLWNVYVNLVKDGVAARLRQTIKGKGERGPDRLHLSAQLPEMVFAQLCAETRDGEVWVNERKVSNEAWDCAVYALAAWLRLGGDKINWSNPPHWARAADQAVAMAAEPVSTSLRDRGPVDRPAPSPIPHTRQAPRARRVLSRGI